MKYIIIYYDWCGEMHLSEHSTIESAILEYRDLMTLYEEDNIWLTEVVFHGEEI